MWDNFVTKKFLKDAGISCMYVRTIDTWLYRRNNDAYYFSEHEMGKEFFYKLEFIKRNAFPEYKD